MQLLQKVGHHVFQIQCIFRPKTETQKLLWNRNVSKNNTRPSTVYKSCGLYYYAGHIL